MRILYLDLDSLRPDHLGCYGYPRNTSPNIDAIAKRGTRFENCYVTDAPCLPSRTALWSGRFGFHTGVVDHGGTAAQPFVEGPSRWFRDQFAENSWMAALRKIGYRTVTIGSFGERHAAWHWYAGYSEIYNLGKYGEERADEVVPPAIAWLKRHAQDENWFLHINLWDVHTPHRTPMSYGHPFEGEPPPEWLSEEAWKRCWDGFGPHSAREPHGYPGTPSYIASHKGYPRVPEQIDSMEAVKQWIDNYDTGIRYADDHIGQLLDALVDAGIYEETAVIVSADHGENLGELNVWADHHTADAITCRVPLIAHWPDLAENPKIDAALHYQFDWAATMIELLGGEVPKNWDAQAFTKAFRAGESQGREALIISQGAWACQRSVRFDHDGAAYLCIRTYHDGHKMLEPIMLFNLTQDPHEQHDISSHQPALVERAMYNLQAWHTHMLQTSRSDVDPLGTVLREGGPFHTRGALPAYLEHLHATGRSRHAHRLAEIHPGEI